MSHSEQGLLNIVIFVKFNIEIQNVHYVLEFLDFYLEIVKYVDVVE